MHLAYCELFHRDLHGFIADSCPNIEGFFITIITIKNPYFFSRNKEAEFHVKMQLEKSKTIQPHPLIRNFSIIQKKSIEPQIVEKIILNTGESICILKTFWLKCIQRKWKKICKYNKNIIKERKKIKNIKNNELVHIIPKQIGLVGMWYKSIS